MTNDSNSPSPVGEVVVNATITDPTGTARSALPDNNTGSVVQEAALKQEINRLASELQRIKSDLNCLVHEECDAIKHYVDRAIERDRLAKRP